MEPAWVIIALTMALAIGGLWIGLIVVSGRLKLLADFVGMTYPQECQRWKTDPHAFHALPGPLSVHVNGQKLIEGEGEDYIVQGDFVVFDFKLKPHTLNPDKIILEKGFRRKVITVTVGDGQEWERWIRAWMTPSKHPPPKDAPRASNR